MAARRIRHSASAAEREFVAPTDRPSTAAPLARSASAHVLRSTGSAPPARRAALESSASTLPSAENTKTSQQLSESDGRAIHVFGWKAPGVGYRCPTPIADISLRHLLATNRGTKAGRLTSEDFGQHQSGFGPGVRRRLTPGVKPQHAIQAQDEAKEARDRTRPRSAFPRDGVRQTWTLEGGRRASDAIGAGEPPKPKKSAWPRFQRILEMRDKQPAELNYLAQFLHVDSRMPPTGGVRRMTKFSDVLDAVAWQKRQIEKAEELSSWENRLDDNARSGRNGNPMSNEAFRIAERQRNAELHVKKTYHASSGNLNVRESYDSIYSDAHADKDTHSVLASGSLVPNVDPRLPNLEAAAGRLTSLPADRPLLPSRSTMGIGTGRGRSIDF